MGSVSGMGRPGVGSGRRGLAAEVVPVLLTQDLPDLTDRERALAADFVDASVAAMPDVLRFGFGLAGRLSGLALRVAGRGRFSSLPAPAQSVLAASVFGRGIPLVADFGAAVRDLGLVAVVEARHSGPEAP
jgi:hypothetical protein